jgi:hypothetical protein
MRVEHVRVVVTADRPADSAISRGQSVCTYLPERARSSLRSKDFLRPSLLHICTDRERNTSRYVDNLKEQNRRLNDELATLKRATPFLSSPPLPVNSTISDISAGPGPVLSHEQHRASKNDTRHARRPSRIYKQSESVEGPALSQDGTTGPRMTQEKDGGVAILDEHTTPENGTEYEWCEVGEEEREDEADGMGANFTGDPGGGGFFGHSSALAFMDRVSASVFSYRPFRVHSVADRLHLSVFDHSPFPIRASLSPGGTSEQPPRKRQRILESDMSALLPHRRLADQLVDAYFAYVHSLYPFLHEPTFRAEYEATWTSQGSSDPVWYCLLNVVFALGCRFVDVESSPTSRPGTSKDPESDSFFKRAHDLITLNILAVGNLRMVQTLLIMGLYLQSTSLPNRCWNVVGMAIRIAQGLALHIPHSDCGPKNYVTEEIRKRTWYGCVTLDR